VVRALDDDGPCGWGVAAGVTAAELDATVERAVALLAATGPGTDGLADVESIEAAGTSTPSDRWSRWAACALATAGWDLRARRAGVSCADLWGRRLGTRSLDAYASGLFLSTTGAALVEEAEHYRAQGFGLVKMRTGLGVEEDLERLERVRRVFPEPGTVAVDAVNAWTPAEADAFVRSAGPLLWVEDPVPLPELAALTELLEDTGAVVAAGESLTDLEPLLALRTDGVDAVLLDVQQVGGPRRFLDATARLAEVGARVGAHVFTPVSTQLLACVDDPLPVEVFDWSDALWATPLRPDRAGQIPVRQPGLGLDLEVGALHRHGRMVHRSRR